MRLFYDIFVSAFQIKLTEFKLFWNNYTKKLKKNMLLKS